LLNDSNLFDELPSQAFEWGALSVRLLEEIDRTELERSKDVLFGREPRHHHDGERMSVHQKL
jgi:hypothetical protein